MIVSLDLKTENIDLLFFFLASRMNETLDIQVIDSIFVNMKIIFMYLE